MQSSPPSTVHDSPMTPSGDDARHVERRNPPARTRRASRVYRANTSASRVRAIANAGRVNSSSRRALDMDRTPSADDLMASFLRRTAHHAGGTPGMGFWRPRARWPECGGANAVAE